MSLFFVDMKYQKWTESQEEGETTLPVFINVNDTPQPLINFVGLVMQSATADRCIVHDSYRFKHW